MNIKRDSSFSLILSPLFLSLLSLFTASSSIGVKRETGPLLLCHLVIRSPEIPFFSSCWSQVASSTRFILHLSTQSLSFGHPLPSSSFSWRILQRQRLRRKQTPSVTVERNSIHSFHQAILSLGCISNNNLTLLLLEKKSIHWTFDLISCVNNRQKKEKSPNRENKTTCKF